VLWHSTAGHVIFVRLLVSKTRKFHQRLFYLFLRLKNRLVVYLLIVLDHYQNQRRVINIYLLVCSGFAYQQPDKYDMTCSTVPQHFSNEANKNAVTPSDRFYVHLNGQTRECRVQVQLSLACRSSARLSGVPVSTLHYHYQNQRRVINIYLLVCVLQHVFEKLFRCGI
jgi:hypothetical protein